MNILRKLLTNLGDTWNKVPKELPFLTIGQGNGQHSLVTVDEGILYLHSVPFRSGLPQRQTIVLKDLTTQELLAIISAMGYVPTIASEAHNSGLDMNKPFILMEVIDVPTGVTLTAFTSNLWRTMYPLYRALRQANGDTSEAMKQLYRDIADGEWLDFWASFFSITRDPGEQDGNFIRRFTMWLFNPKTNNIALKELLAYQLQDTDFDVHDKDTALQFEVVLGIKYLTNASALHKILQQTKAAGVEYFLNYAVAPYFEDYREYMADANGTPWETSDTSRPALLKTLADTFATPSEALDVGGFMKTMADTFASPSEASTPSLLWAMADTFAAPLDVRDVSALLKTMAETFAAPLDTVTIGGLLQKSDYEVYPLVGTLATNVSTSFATNDSLLNTDVLFGSNNIEVASATLTVGGTVVEQRTL